MMTWYKFRNGGKVPYLRRNTGGATPTTATGIPAAGFARPAIDTYLAGTNPYQIDFGRYAGTGYKPSQYGDYGYELAPIPVPVTPTNTGGGGDSTPIATTTTPEWTGDAVDDAGTPAPYKGVDPYDKEGDDNFLTEEETAAQEQIIADAFDSIDTFDSTKTAESQLTPEEYDAWSQTDATADNYMPMSDPAVTAADTIYMNNQQIYGEPTGNLVTSLVTGAPTDVSNNAVSKADEIAAALDETGLSNAVTDAALGVVRDENRKEDAVNTTTALEHAINRDAKEWADSAPEVPITLTPPPKEPTIDTSSFKKHTPTDTSSTDRSDPLPFTQTPEEAAAAAGFDMNDPSTWKGAAPVPDNNAPPAPKDDKPAEKPRTIEEIRSSQTVSNFFKPEKLSSEDKATLAKDAQNRARAMAEADDGRGDRIALERGAVAKLTNEKVLGVNPNDRSITKLGKKAAAAKAKELGLSIPGDEGGQALSRAIKDAQGIQKISQNLDAAKAASRSKQKAQDMLAEMGYGRYDKDSAPDILRQKIREAEVGLGAGAKVASAPPPPQPVPQTQPTPPKVSTSAQADIAARKAAQQAAAARAAEAKAAAKAKQDAAVAARLASAPQVNAGRTPAQEAEHLKAVATKQKVDAAIRANNPNLSNAPKQKGTVICTALHDLGHIDTRTWTLSERWSVLCVDRETYDGYMHWATPVAEKIREKHWFYHPVFKFLGTRWAKQMAHEVSKGRSGEESVIGYLCCRIGAKISKAVGRRLNKEVSHDVAV